MRDKAYLRRKLAALHGYLKELQTISQLTLIEYKTDFVRRRAAEKVVELIVEEAIDINRAIIEAAQVEPPQTSFNTFIELEQLGILPHGLAARLANATGLRNRLVHRYEEIDHKMVYDALKPLLRNYRKYTQLIEDYVERGVARRTSRK
jgi:uncharacterized protein YutE (UPF0331/DUF86 family)